MLKSLYIFFLFFLAFGSKDINLPSEQPINAQIPKTDQISIPLLLNYQGKITDNIGNPVRDSNYSVTFRLFNVPSGGTAFWNETQTIQTRAGLFHTLLGSINPIPSLPLDGNCYLEMQVNPNPPMTPRIRIVSSAYAYLSRKADSASYATTAGGSTPTGPAGGDLTGTYPNPTIANNAVNSAKIEDGAIMGVDLNPMGAGTGQVLKWTGSAWAPANDSAGGPPTGPAGGDLTGTYPNPTIANNAVNSAKIQDGTIANADLADGAVTSAKIADTNVTMSKIQRAGATTGQVLKWTGSAWAPANDSAGGPPTGPAGGDLTGTYPNPTIANNAVNSAKIQDGQVANADLGANAVTGDKIQDGTVTSADIRDTTITAAKIKDGAVTSVKIADGTIVRADVVTNFKAPYSDTADYARVAPAVDSARVAGNAHRLQGKDTLALSAKFVDEGQANSITSAMITDGQVANADIADGAVNSAKIADGTIAAADIGTNAVTSAKIADTNVTMSKIQRAGATTGQVLKWTGSAWAPRNDSIGQSDNAWVRGTPDSVLYTIRQLGIARGGSGNMLYGSYRYTHTNLGVACTTGTSGQNYQYCTVGGGAYNTASAGAATVAGGAYNTASGVAATVAGGDFNTASGNRATVAGGYENTASGSYATVAGGWADTSAASYSFTTNYHSVVPSSYFNSAAFNGQTATASSQLRCGTLSKAGGTFTIDHPLDPYGKILNHYFIEGPEMLNIYRGSVVLDASGRAEVRLPDYFSALNRNPHIQLTGVGTREVVYVAEDIKDNRFVIGGPANAKVYWLVTGERKDVSAEAIRRMMPVEQPKTGELKGRMLDDDFLVGCMEQLEREGKAEGINFRTPEGRKRYEDMKIKRYEDMKIRRKGE